MPGVRWSIEFDGLQQMLSLANPPLELVAPPDKSPELARLANDSLAEVCRRYPDQFPDPSSPRCR